MTSEHHRHGGPDGVAIIDKPAGWTSHDVVAKARGLLGTRKVGHSGTLDPDVTGVLVLGIGRATRLLRYTTALGKRYEGTFILGVETTTLDASGDIVATHDLSDVTLADLQQVAATRFVGPILQIPPMVSAVKVGGRRLHELARAGIEVAREPRPVTIHELEISALDEPGTPTDGVRYSIAVHASSGTYVRSLIADLGTAVGGGAHLETLRRTAVGSFTIDEAIALADLKPEHVLNVSETVRDLEQIVAPRESVGPISHGARFARDELGIAPDSVGPWAVVDPSGELLAVYEDRGAGMVKPTVVVAAAH